MLNPFVVAQWFVLQKVAGLIPGLSVWSMGLVFPVSAWVLSGLTRFSVFCPTVQREEGALKCLWVSK